MAPQVCCGSIASPWLIQRRCDSGGSQVRAKTFCDVSKSVLFVGSVRTSWLVPPASLLFNISEVLLHPGALKARAACGALRSGSRVVFDAIDWQEGPNLFRLFR